MIQQACVEGVSARRVDDLTNSLGCDGISKNQVSRICGDLAQVVSASGGLSRPLDSGPYPYVWLDALTQKVKESGRPPQADQRGGGHRHQRPRSAGELGIDVGASEDGAFWPSGARTPAVSAWWNWSSPTPTRG